MPIHWFRTLLSLDIIIHYHNHSVAYNCISLTHSLYHTALVKKKKKSTLEKSSFTSSSWMWLRKNTYLWRIVSLEFMTLNLKCSECYNNFVSSLPAVLETSLYLLLSPQTSNTSISFFSLKYWSWFLSYWVNIVRASTFSTKLPCICLSAPFLFLL